MEKIERLCISLHYVETFNSKVIKGFVPELRSRYVFFVFRDSYVLCIYVMNILCTFHISLSWVCHKNISVFRHKKCINIIGSNLKQKMKKNAVLMILAANLSEQKQNKWLCADAMDISNVMLNESPSSVKIPRTVRAASSPGLQGLCHCLHQVIATLYFVFWLVHSCSCN